MDLMHCQLSAKLSCGVLGDADIDEGLMLQGCPCSTTALCQADKLGNFGVECSWKTNSPGYWYFGHGGECLLSFLSSLFCMTSSTEKSACVSLCSIGEGICKTNVAFVYITVTVWWHACLS